MPPRHVRSYSDFYRHGRRSSPVAIKKKPKKLQKVRHFSDSAVLSVSRKRSKHADGINWRSIKRWVIAIVVLGWIALPLYAPYFRVKDITFENFPSDLQMNARMLAHDTIEPSFFVVPSNNYFIIKTDAVKTALAERFSTVENISVTKKFPNQLVISATEKSPAVIYDNGKNYYTLDSEGNILHQIGEVGEDELKPVTVSSSDLSASTSSSFTASSTENLPNETTSLKQIHTPNYKKISQQFGSYPLIYDDRENVIIGSGSVLPSSTIAAVVNWQKWLLESKLVTAHYYTLNNLNSSIEVSTDKVWVIDFRPNDVLRTQFDNFKAAVQDSIKNKTKITDHIDVSYSRPDSRVIYVK